jgi:hypothetical protein
LLVGKRGRTSVRAPSIIYYGREQIEGCLARRSLVTSPLAFLPTSPKSTDHARKDAWSDSGAGYLKVIPGGVTSSAGWTGRPKAPTRSGLDLGRIIVGRSSGVRTHPCLSWAAKYRLLNLFASFDPGDMNVA